MMQILKAGGMEILTDNVRQPDVNNPRGYFEYEKVKSLQKDNSWLGEAERKAVKIIIQLIPYLPVNLEYSVILMKRNTGEIMLSQEKMIATLGGKKSSTGNDALKKVFESQLRKIEEYLSSNNCFKKFTINYNKLINEDKSILKELNSFLNLNLNIENTDTIIDSSLYRNRAAD
jgi:hypothetical protein